MLLPWIRDTYPLGSESLILWDPDHLSSGIRSTYPLGSGTLPCKREIISSEKNFTLSDPAGTFPWNWDIIDLTFWNPDYLILIPLWDTGQRKKGRNICWDPDHFSSVNGLSYFTHLRVVPSISFQFLIMG